MARILVIDDSRDTLEMLRVILHERGHHDVTLSTNGKEGLEKAVSEHPDLAIIDVMMPEMTGYEVVGRIRANARIADLPIIILTARGQPVDKIAAMEAGADLHMSKPVDVETLLEQVDVLLGANKKQEGAALFPILSLRGGVGTTTIAVNLALLMQQIKPTVLVDLSPNSGHCAAHLGLKVRTHWGQFKSGTTVAELLQEHTSGLKLLPAPLVPVQDEGLSHQESKALLDKLRRTTQFIVVDMPPTLTQTAQLFLEEAQRIVLVSGDDLPSIQTTRQTAQLLKPYQDRLLLVLNTITPGPHPPAEMLQRALNMPIEVRLAHEAQQIKAIHTGSPLVLGTPASALTTDLQQLTRKLIA